MRKNRACFLDRDGVVNEEVGYLHDPGQVKIIAGVAEALALLQQNGYKVIVVSNQSGVARKFYTEAEVDAVNSKINKILRQSGVAIDGFYYCPHHPDFGADCDCRKPKPGMILTAAREFDIAVADSFMVGDRISDLIAANAAGCSSCYLVETGYGKEQEIPEHMEKVKRVPNLLAAVEDFLFQSNLNFG